MSIAQRSKMTKSKKTIQDQGGVIKLVQDLSNKVQQLEQKIISIESIKQSNKPQNVKHLERKMVDLERKLSSTQRVSAPQNNSREIKMLNNIINEDLNKIKIKLEKHEDLIKKMLFN